MCLFFSSSFNWLYHARYNVGLCKKCLAFNQPVGISWGKIFINLFSTPLKCSNRSQAEPKYTIWTNAVYFFQTHFGFLKYFWLNFEPQNSMNTFLSANKSGNHFFFRFTWNINQENTLDKNVFSRTVDNNR